MELTNRILEILEKSGLTPSEFADKIEVQRSAISHITSGRNKPSLEFLIKIKQAFPEIDTDWLIFGIEKEQELEENSPETENTQNSDSSFPTLLELFEVEEKQPEKETLNENQPNSPSVETPTAIKIPLNAHRKVVKTLLLYNDGTFEEFLPSV